MAVFDGVRSTTLTVSVFRVSYGILAVILYAVL